MNSVQNPHILYLTPGFPLGDSDSYTVTYFVNFLEQIQNNHPNIKLSVISFLYPEQNIKYKWEGIDVYPMGVGNNASKFGKWGLWSKVRKTARQINSNHPLSAIHALWYRECALLAKQIGKRLKLKPIVTIMGTELNHSNIYFKLIKPNNFKLVGVSERQEELVKAKLHRPFDKVIPWGIPEGFVKKEPRKKENDILFAGFLNELKNLPLFIEVIKELVVIFPKLKVKIVGEDYSNGGWLNEIKRSGLNNNVEILGVVRNAEMLAVMSRSKILLHTSNFETQGYVIWEAIATGMHVISKAVGIAEKGEKLDIAMNKSEFVALATEILKNYKPSPGFNPYPIEKTVHSYLQLYECI